MSSRRWLHAVVRLAAGGTGKCSEGTVRSPQRALLRAGIRPDNHILYTAADIVTAVEEDLGVQPLVHCVGGKISEVRTLLYHHTPPPSVLLQAFQGIAAALASPQSMHSPSHSLPNNLHTRSRACRQPRVHSAWQ